MTEFYINKEMVTFELNRQKNESPSTSNDHYWTKGNGQINLNNHQSIK